MSRLLLSALVAIALLPALPAIANRYPLVSAENSPCGWISVKVSTHYKTNIIVEPDGGVIIRPFDFKIETSDSLPKGLPGVKSSQRLSEEIRTEIQQKLKANELFGRGRTEDQAYNGLTNQLDEITERHKESYLELLGEQVLCDSQSGNLIEASTL